MTVFASLIQAVRERGAGGYRLCFMVEAFFGDGTMRIFPGIGTVRSTGRTWRGSGGTVQLSGLDLQSGFAASKIELKMSGVDAGFQAKAVRSEAIVTGRPIRIWLQGFRDDWQPIGDALVVWWGTMDVMTAEGSAEEGGTITLTAESPFVTRNMPRNSFWTDQSQKELYPTDRGLEFIGTLEDKVVRPPVK